MLDPYRELLTPCRGSRLVDSQTFSRPTPTGTQTEPGNWLRAVLPDKPVVLRRRGYTAKGSECERRTKRRLEKTGAVDVGAKSPKMARAAASPPNLATGQLSPAFFPPFLLIVPHLFGQGGPRHNSERNPGVQSPRHLPCSPKQWNHGTNRPCRHQRTGEHLR